MALDPGDTLLNGHYRILGLLGRGGFGFVYLAQDTLLGEQVAVKELIPALVGDEAMLKRFLAEARATMRLTHRHIVRTHNVFHERGNYYIVMEYMAGGSLEERLRATDRLPVSEAVRVAAEVCEGLSCAHEEQVVHCDLKPANILFDAAGRAKVADFGIAHVSGEMLTRSWVTPAGFVAGTLPYMSPEQAEGVRDDPRIDVYAMGAVLYRMLTGRTYLDFDQRETPGAQADNVLRIRSEPPTAPSIHNPTVSAQLDAVVVKALAKQPGGRYNSADEMRAALLRMKTPTLAMPLTQPVAERQRPAGPRAAAGPGIKKRTPLPGWFWAAAGVAGVLLVLLVLAVGLLLRHPDATVAADPGPTWTSVAVVTTAPAVQPADTPISTSRPTSSDPTPSTPAVAPTHTQPTWTAVPDSTLPLEAEPTLTPQPEPTRPPLLEAKIAFSAQRPDSEPDIYIMAPNGTGAVQLTFDPGYDSGPDWSPDGRYLAFHSNRSGNYDLYVMSREGEQVSLERLTTSPANDYDASWSPDGTQIVFMSDRTGNREIFVMARSGTDVRQLTNTASSDCSPGCERQPAWSPSGQVIVFESRRSDGTQLYAMTPSGQNQRPVTTSQGNNTSPEWSPEGLIAFASTRDPGNRENRWPEIYTTDLSGGNLVRLTSNTADDDAPDWSPDGRRIVFASKRDSCPNQRDDDGCDWNLYVMRPNGSEVQRLANTPNLSEFNPAWWGP